MASVGGNDIRARPNSCGPANPFNNDNTYRQLQELYYCGFTKWYSDFKDITIHSKYITLPKEILDYLNADGLVLPSSSQSQELGTTTLNNCTINANGLNDDLEDVKWSDDEEEEDDNGCEIEVSTEFKNQVTCMIEDLGGVAFPKLDWSSPKDATWIAFGNTLKCSTLNDILLLLKSSTFISHDLNNAISECDDYDPDHHLVLRKWEDLNPASEFRCFVKRQNLIAISQRDHATCYSYIHDNRDIIPREITQFYLRYLHGRFHNQSYVFDVYRRETDSYWLIDFNVFSTVTDSLLFSWDELSSTLTESSSLTEPSSSLTDPSSSLTDPSSSLTDPSSPLTDSTLMMKPAFRYLINSPNPIRTSEYHLYSYPQEISALSLHTDEAGRVLNDFINLNISDLQLSGGAGDDDVSDDGDDDVSDDGDDNVSDDGDGDKHNGSDNNK